METPLGPAVHLSPNSLTSSSSPQLSSPRPPTNYQPKESTTHEFQPNEPTVPKSQSPLIHSQVLTSSSFRSVPKANRLLNSLSITWRAWSP